MTIVKNSISRSELNHIADEQYGDMVKAVVDLEHEIMAVGGEFHADGEVVLMEQEGARREYTWGINLYPDSQGDDFIEYDSMINLKPAFGNRTRNVADKEIREKIKHVVEKLVTQ
ncbi:MAG: hypothetical protein A2719_04880 [Candidatus Ryanbacteria bacterium RIFCSPHIGHO2_01_FULL_45_22]|uniref:Uncharacterized protein n=1 Tax=Candidatus Ryanbacteria bacterium RIFCSPHIGHO2_01_FULL_45_22 TaxID=1802114 RepID=A0A1G2G317_9BACT|nr:MAG: hypothetical protein A2719_04880 [Candidatus Ryanbacteria bacterium RIFCSPHIGHO2_01_FULL_45_22]